MMDSISDIETSKSVPIRTPAQEERKSAIKWFFNILQNNWAVLILGLFVIGLPFASLLLLLFNNLNWFQSVVLLSCVAFFPLTYLAYQLRSEKHIERIVVDFMLLGLVSRDQEELVQKQYQKIHSPQQYIIYVSLAALVTLLGFGLLYFNPNLFTGFMDAESKMITMTMFYSFLGAFVFSIFNVYRRFVTFDLQPGVYLYVVVMMLTVMIIAFVLAGFLDTSVKTRVMIPVVAFAIGYFPDIGMRWIVSIAGRTTGRISRNETSLSSIDGISIWHETRLREAGIDNTQNLQACDVRELLLSSRFSAQQIMNWIDQAILICNVAPPVLKELNRYSIRTITAFQSFVDNEGFGNLPDLPLEVIFNAQERTKKPKQEDRPPLTQEGGGGDKAAHQASVDHRSREAINRKNLRALYQAIYHAANTSPNYHYVTQYWYGVKLFRTRQVETAVQRSLRDLGIMIVESLFLEPDMIERMGRAWTDLGLPLEILPTLFSNTPDGKVALGNVYVQLDRFPDALQAFSDAISLAPEYAPTYASRGMAQAIRRSFAEAFADFNKAKQLAPDYAVTYHHEGVALMKRGYYKEAVNVLSMAVQKDSLYALAYFNRGRARSYLNDFDGAQEDFTRALQLKNMPAAYYERGVIFARKAMVRQAIEDFNKAIRLERGNANTYASRGLAYLVYGDFNRSLYDLNSAIEFDPTLAVAYAYRGQLNFKLGDEDSAVEDYTKALELDSRLVSVFYNRGLAYQSQGNIQNAINDFREYLRLTPEASDFKEVAKLITQLEEKQQANPGNS